MKVSSKASESASKLVIPPGCDPKHIGCVVTVQVFERENLNSDSIKAETLTKHVGVLETYTLFWNEADKAPMIAFMLRGHTTARLIDLEDSYVEFILR